MQHVILVIEEILCNYYVILGGVTGDWSTSINVYLKINGTDSKKSLVPMEAFATVKLPQFLIGEYPRSSGANMALLCVKNLQRAQ